MGLPGAGTRWRYGPSGTRHTRVLPDGWTVVTKDRKLSAQWEHTVAVTADGAEILTRLPGDDNDL